MSTPNRSAACSNCTLPELFTRAGVRVVGGGVLPSVKITSLTDDSRAVERGGCFVAIRGKGVDGHRFIEAAAGAGAAVIVVDRDVAVPNTTVICAIPASLR